MLSLNVMKKNLSVVMKNKKDSGMKKTDSVKKRRNWKEIWLSKKLKNKSVHVAVVGDTAKAK